MREAHPELELAVATGEPAEVARTAVAAAKNGSVVVRLVAGDPFTTDAVVKEALAVTRTSVPFDVVPGVAVGSAVPAYAGVAVGAGSVQADLRGEDAADPAALAAAATTTGSPLVLQVAADQLAGVAAGLVEGGLPGSTPVLVTVEGTGTAQRSVAAKLAQVGRRTPAWSRCPARSWSPSARSWTSAASSAGGVPPAVRLARAGAAHQGAGRRHERAAARLRRRAGRGPHHRRGAPRSPAQMDRAVKGLVTGRYGWIVFTSTNAVRAVREKFTELGLDARAFAGVKVACVGEQTAQAVREFGIVPELVPSGDQSSEGLLVDFPPYDDVFDPIDRVLLPRADIATETLTAGLKDRGWEVDDVTAYRTVRAAPPAAASARRSRAAASTPSASPRPRPCATWSASPASRTPAPSSR